MTGIWDVSILTALKKSRFSLLYIVGGFLTIVLLSFVVPREYQKFMFFFYGMIIIYTALIYDMKRALLITISSFIGHIMASWSAFGILFALARYQDIVVEGVLIVVAYFFSCLFIAKILLNERQNQKQLRHMANVNARVASELSSANHQISNLYTNTIQVLAAAIDAKDPYTKGHSERVTNYAVAVAKKMSLPKKDIQNIFYAAILHDIGKIGINEAILLKPGPLTSKEYKNIERHPEIGAKILSSVPFLDEVVPIVLHHHEFFNGQGYPTGLSGVEIPLGSRIISVVDAFDAIHTDRPYRKGYDKEKALWVLKEGEGKQFDPEIVRIFSEIVSTDKGIAGLAEAASEFYGQDS